MFRPLIGLSCVLSRATLAEAEVQISSTTLVTLISLHGIYIQLVAAAALSHTGLIASHRIDRHTVILKQESREGLHFLTFIL